MKLHALQKRLALRISWAYTAAMALAEIIPAEYVTDALAKTYIRVKVIREGEGVITPQSITCGRKPASEDLQTVEV